MGADERPNLTPCGARTKSGCAYQIPTIVRITRAFKQQRQAGAWRFWKMGGKMVSNPRTPRSHNPVLYLHELRPTNLYRLLILLLARFQASPRMRGTPGRTRTCRPPLKAGALSTDYGRLYATVQHPGMTEQPNQQAQRMPVIKRSLVAFQTALRCVCESGGRIITQHSPATSTLCAANFLNY